MGLSAKKAAHRSGESDLEAGNRLSLHVVAAEGVRVLNVY